MKKTEKKGLDILTVHKIMGDLIIDIGVIERLFDFIPENLRQIPFTERELEIHANEGHRLYLEMPHTNDGQSLNIESLAKIACRKGNKIGPNKYLFWRNQFSDDGSIKPEAMFYNDILVRNATSRLCWKIASKEVIFETLNHNYIDQTDILIGYTKRIYKNNLPEHYKQAVSEWEAKRLDLKEILHTKKISGEIVRCKIFFLTRESFVSSEYRRLLIYKAEDRKILQSHWNWSNTCNSDSEFVCVGGFDPSGVSVYGNAPGHNYAIIGASFSRSL